MLLINRIRIVQCCIITACIIGCSDKGTNSITVVDEKTIAFSEFPKEDHIDFKNLYEYKEGTHCVLELIDSTLVCMNVSNKQKFHFFNYKLATGELSNGYASNGRGPGELLGTMAFGAVDNIFWAYDITKKEILTSDRKKTLTEGVFEIKSVFAVKQDQYKIKLKDSLHYFAVGYPNSNYQIQERELYSGKLTKEFGAFENIPDDISLSAYKSLKQSFLFLRPKGDKLVLARRFEDVIEIYDTEKQALINRVHGPEGFEAEGLIRGDVFYHNHNTRISFKAGTLTNNYIYMGYCGYPANSENASVNQCIYVYDWEGNPIRKIVFENSVGSIAVSEDDKTMYAFDRNTGYILQAAIR
jgi:hypothetical protein